MPSGRVHHIAARGLLALAVILGSLSLAEGDEPPRKAALIPSDTFIASPFSEFFRAGDYGQALAALDALAKDYPDDPMLVRYRAIVLDRLGRFDEAMALYDQLLAKDPNHVPTRYFRAQTYNRKGDKPQAIDELKWIVQHSPSKEYRQWSEEQLRQLGVMAVRPVERRRFYLFGNTGWEYDSNAILKSNDPGTGFGADKNASRLNLNLGLGYRAIQQRKLRFDIIYTARQSLNDDGLDELNFTAQELALDLRRRVTWLDQDITLGARYEFNAGFLDGNLFSIDNQLRLSSDIRFSPRIRTYLYNRFTVSDFGPDGSNPPQTSRDGFGYDLGVTQYFYSSDYRSYVFFTEELNLDDTRGANFTRHGTSTRAGLRTPVPFLPKTDFDTSAGFRWGSYPRFTSLSSLDRSRRFDNNWDYYVALTHRITPRVSTRAFYRLINANNRNDFFQYDRHLAGLQLLFTQYF
jgi:tetratricopeptide (TPR) repeat protein